MVQILHLKALAKHRTRIIYLRPLLCPCLCLVYIFCMFCQHLVYVMSMSCPCPDHVLSMRSLVLNFLKNFATQCNAMFSCGKKGKEISIRYYEWNPFVMLLVFITLFWDWSGISFISSVPLSPVCIRMVVININMTFHYKHLMVVTWLTFEKQKKQKKSRKESRIKMPPESNENFHIFFFFF